MVLGKGASSSLDKTQVDFFSFLFIIVVSGLNRSPVNVKLGLYHCTPY